MAVPVFRFAPSPNGYLHLGHAYSALLNADMARAANGRLLLRIEDIDRERSRPSFEDAMLEDLAWLGFNWEKPVRRQSEHFADYAAALEKLRAGGLVYPAFESRAEIARMVAERGSALPHDPDGSPLYPGSADRLSAHEQNHLIASGAPFAWRLNMGEAVKRSGIITWDEQGSGPLGETGLVQARPEAWGDVIIARKDMPTSYHLAVVVDDALQGVTHVVRGQDLFWATSIHRLLQVLLTLPGPKYHHHGLIRSADGEKLAKSAGAMALRELRAQSEQPADIRRRIGL